MQNVFGDLGYHFKWQILDARNYGIPQGRRRLFVVGFKDEKQANRFNFPEPITLKFTMQDFLYDNCAKVIFNMIKTEILDYYRGQLVEKHLSQKLIDLY